MKNVRLTHAVRSSQPLPRARLWNRVFTWWFNGLVYPQIWEDPELDLEALRLTSDSRIVTIASGGCNALNYLVADPKEIIAVDLNPAHVALTRLKTMAAVKLPSYESFFRFFGRADDAANRAAYRRYLRPHLDPDTRAYWDKRKMFLGARVNLFTRNIYRHGLLGHFLGVVHVVARLYGRNPGDILHARTLDEQREYFAAAFAPLFETRLIRLLCRSPLSIMGLGIPPAQFGALAGAGNGDLAAVLRARLERLACQFPVADNYFAWQAFARHYDVENKRALPLYLQEAHYELIRSRADRVRVELASITEFLRKEPDRSLSGYVLLDAQDWMDDDKLRDLWTEITRTARPGARVVFRTAAEDSVVTGRLPPEILDRWAYDRAECARLVERDRSSVYGGFHVYTLR